MQNDDLNKYDPSPYIHTNNNYNYENIIIINKDCQYYKFIEILTNTGDITTELFVYLQLHTYVHMYINAQ